MQMTATRSLLDTRETGRGRPSARARKHPRRPVRGRLAQDRHRGQAPASPGPGPVPATADPAATSWSSLPMMRNLSLRPWPLRLSLLLQRLARRGLRALRTALVLVGHGYLLQKERPGADRITLDPSTELLDAEGRTRAR